MIDEAKERERFEAWCVIEQRSIFLAALDAKGGEHAKE